nr:Chain U, Death-associated protein kinase 1 [Homo sapiens]
LGLPDLVAKYN